MTTTTAKITPITANNLAEVNPASSIDSANMDRPIGHPPAAGRGSWARWEGESQGLASCTAMATVAVSIRPQGCGNPQTSVSTQDQKTTHKVCQMLMRVERSGSACFHHRGRTIRKPK